MYVIGFKCFKSLNVLNVVQIINTNYEQEWAQDSTSWGPHV